MAKSLVIALCVLFLGAGLAIMLAPALLKRVRRHTSGRVGEAAWVFHRTTELVGFGFVGIAVAIIVFLALR